MFLVKHDLHKVAERDRHSPFPLVPMAEAVSIVLKYAPVLGTRKSKNLQGNSTAKSIG